MSSSIDKLKQLREQLCSQKGSGPSEENSCDKSIDDLVKEMQSALMSNNFSHDQIRKGLEQIIRMIKIKHASHSSASGTNSNERK